METKVVTSSGFKVTINSEAFDDMKLLDSLSDLAKGNPLALTEVLHAVLTPEDIERLYNHVKTAQGRVPVSKVEAELTEIFKNTKFGKN